MLRAPPRVRFRFAVPFYLFEFSRFFAPPARVWTYARQTAASNRPRYSTPHSLCQSNQRGPSVRITQSKNSHRAEDTHAQVLRCAPLLYTAATSAAEPSQRYGSPRIAPSHGAGCLPGASAGICHYIVSSAWVSTRAFSLRPPSPCTSRMSMPAALAARFSALDCAIRVSLSVRW